MCACFQEVSGDYRGRNRADLFHGSGRGSRKGHNRPTSTGGGVRYPDAAYDDVNNVFLAVTGKKKVQGRFLSASGTLLRRARSISPRQPRYQQAPRAHCGEGVCLVVWHEGDSGTTPMARLVSYTDGFVSSPFAIGPKGSMWEMGAGIAYSPAANQFLVAWHGNYGSGNNIWIARVTTGGQVVNKLAVTTTTAYEREPSVAYNAASGEFVVVYAGTVKVNGIETAYVRAQRVKDGTPLGGPIQLDSAKASYISWAEYNPTTQSVLATWSRGGTKIYGRAISAAGSIGSLLTLSTSYGAYDALDVSFNPVTQSFLLVTHGSTVEDVGIELSSSYAPSPAFVLTANGGTGNFNPRVASSTASATWMAVTAKSFASLVAQYATGTAGSGAGGGGGSPNPVQITGLASNPSPPFAAGNAVTFTATATGGSGTLQYAFWLQDSISNQWVLARSYSSSNSFTWTPQAVDAGAHNLQVWVRPAGSSADVDAARQFGPFTVTSATPAIKSLSANRSFPSAVGVPITWTVDARGGTGALEYSFYRYNVASGIWAKVAGYSTNNTFTWTPPVPGKFLLQAWVRNVGSSANYQAYKSTGNFVITSGTPNLIVGHQQQELPCRARHIRYLDCERYRTHHDRIRILALQQGHRHVDARETLQHEQPIHVVGRPRHLQPSGVGAERRFCLQLSGLAEHRDIQGDERSAVFSGHNIERSAAGEGEHRYHVPHPGERLVATPISVLALQRGNEHVEVAVRFLHELERVHLDCEGRHLSTAGLGT